ncbi:tyrosine-type recombinase/integrase [Mesorhizobium sp. M0292]|uniref:tyrosine-type recombinase/integrase n=1 Tax=Mesorhizobium sp. M0292 TaxID=2956929 RepID=UPI00333BA56D
MGKALTAASLLKLKADPAKRREIPDGVLTGLYFVIQPTGRKAWAVRYRAAGAPKKVTLGNSFFGDDADAAGQELTRMRHEAASVLERVRRGEDPGAEKQAAKRAPKPDADRDLFLSVATRYLREYAAKRRNYPEKARLLGMRQQDGEWKTNADRAAGLWGAKRIHDITRRDIREHLETIATAAPIGANRTFAELRKFFNWTVGKDILDTSPMADLQAPSEENDSRNRVLIRRKEVPGSSDDELRWLWRASQSYDDTGRGPFGSFLQLLVLTGQRRSEVAEMTWPEVDLNAREWVIPAARSKNGEPHVVPLSKPALAVLKAVPKIKGKGGYLFTTDGEHPISGFSRMKQRLDKLMAGYAAEVDASTDIPPWTLHDIRRTVAAGMQRVGVKMEVTEKVLNHKSGSFRGIAGIYQVHDYADEKRAALDSWASFLMTLVDTKKASNVVRMRASK